MLLALRSQSEQPLVDSIGSSLAGRKDTSYTPDRLETVQRDVTGHQILSTSFQTYNTGVVQLGRTLHFECRSWEFKSLLLFQERPAMSEEKLRYANFPDGTRQPEVGDIVCLCPIQDRQPNLPERNMNARPGASAIVEEIKVITHRSGWASYIYIRWDKDEDLRNGQEHGSYNAFDFFLISPLPEDHLIPLRLSRFSGIMEELE